MLRSYVDSTHLFQAISSRCHARPRHKLNLSLLLCVFLVGLFAQSVFAAVDIYIYKSENGALRFTTVPKGNGYTRVIRREQNAETKARLSQAIPKKTIVQLFRNEETAEIGYFDGETFIPLWPESYITLTARNTFLDPSEYQDIWVNGLSEQVGPIKMRQGVPLDVTVTAIDWLIERNLDKYKPTITNQPNRRRPTFFFILLAIMLASLVLIVVRNYYNTLSTIPFRIRTAIDKHAVSNPGELIFLFISRHYNTLERFSVRIIAAINKFGLDNCCQYCKEHTENDTRICDDCQIRVQTEKTNPSHYERQEREQRTRPNNEGGRDRTDSKHGFDPYQVLQIRSGANKEEIKAAYLNLIKQYHPDRVSHLGQEFQQLAEEKAQLINRAYEHLMAN
jgi:DnaJ domain